MSLPTRFPDLFPAAKPIIGMLHLNGSDRPDRLRRALREAEILTAAGFDGLIVENYFGDQEDVVAVLEAFGRSAPEIRIGLNLLGDTATAFELASLYRVDFIQIDSVCGHLRPDMDQILGETLERYRIKGVPLLGGVRFKYQPVNSGRSEDEDLRLGARRCDAIVVTGTGTGIETDVDKIRRFRALVPEGFPLIVGAGLTIGNVAEQLASADGGIVGSWLKTGHVDRGEMEPEYLVAFMDAVRNARNAAGNAQGHS